MRLIIHRGTHQIGGCAAEVRTDAARILIDLGSELPDEDGLTHPDTLQISGVMEGAQNCDGVFFTHYHNDHIGLIDKILPGIPLYMGESAREIALLLNRRIAHAPHTDRTAAIAALERAQAFVPGVAITVGDIRVTPYLIDHSAFDAYFFLIEAQGVRVLHTGDFRLHGFRGGKTLAMLKQYVGQVDWLICDGTLLSRDAAHIKSERELQDDERALMKRYKRVFVLCASTNLDRIAGFYHARPDARPLVCDGFQKSLLDAVSARHGGKSSLYRFPYAFPYSEQNQKLLSLMDERGFVMLLRVNDWSRKMLEKYGEGAVVAYSMWEGYLRGKDNDLPAMLAGHPSVYMHTSGHAATEDTIHLCDTVDPRCGVIPIHTLSPKRFSELLPGRHIELLRDGEVFAL